MKQDEALGLLNQVCLLFKGTRDEHMALSQALDVVRKGLEDKNPELDKNPKLKEDEKTNEK